MCYAIPGKLTHIEGNVGTVDYFGESRKVFIDSVDIAVGDYVYAQGGIVINKMDEETAAFILNTWEEMFVYLKETDRRLSLVSNNPSSPRLGNILQKVQQKEALSEDDALYLLSLEKTQDLALLYESANNVRFREHGNACCVHGVIEFSNYCDKHCWYCGIRQEKKLERYRLTPDRICEIAKDSIDSYGFKGLVLQGGEDEAYDDETLEYIIRRVRAMNVLVFLSIGVRKPESYEKYWEAGARAALMRFETSNRKQFNQYRPGTDFEERLELLKWLKKRGFVLATGFLIGLPGEEAQDIYNNILLTREIAPDMYSFGPLIPTADTPLEKAKIPDARTVLKSIAVARLLDPKANILVTTAMETLDIRTKKGGLMAGANSLMVNLTPNNYKKLYNIYDNRFGVNQEIGEQVSQTVEMLISLGRSPMEVIYNR
jgi:biotin synthase